MSDLSFSWDEKKNSTNLEKHGVSFEEAQSVFLDDNARLFSDPDHSEEEDRFILLGLSSKPRLLIVCHCHRESGQIIRLISARKATKKETKIYGGL